MRLRQLMAIAAILVSASLASGQSASSALAKIKAVGREGAGNVEAAAAWNELVRLGPAVLPELLGAFDDSGPTSANWLRAAAEQIRDDAVAAKSALPVDKLEAFVRDTRHTGNGRRLAYELLVGVDPGAPDRLLPGMLDDPGAELRRDAVARLLTDVAALVKAKDPTAADTCKKVLRHARDRDQVDLAAKHLKALGIDIDLTIHYGFITHWLVAGPFDNSKGAGFSKMFGPEAGVEDVWTLESQSKPGREHPAVFPQELVQRCLAIGNPHLGPVLDPFAGSATVLRTALETGADADGIDLNREYCRDAAADLGR